MSNKRPDQEKYVESQQDLTFLCGSDAITGKMTYLKKQKSAHRMNWI